MKKIKPVGVNRSGDYCLANLDDFLKTAHKRKKIYTHAFIAGFGKLYYENCYFGISFKLILIHNYFLIAYFFS